MGQGPDFFSLSTESTNFRDLRKSMREQPSYRSKPKSTLERERLRALEVKRAELDLECVKECVLSNLPKDPIVVVRLDGKSTWWCW